MKILKKFASNLRATKGTLTITMLCAAIAVMALGFEEKPVLSKLAAGGAKKMVFRKDSIASIRAFKQVYTVLKSPRCMNCHPAGDIPLQGEDSHLHTMSPRRGLDGRGVYAMKCSNCHQPENSPGVHTPPGNPKWHLPPAHMRMVFQGRTAAQLARQIMDPKQNGNKNMQQLLEHADDTLVKAGWNPGEGRKLPPMSHAAFKKAWLTWLTNGAYAPKSNKS